MFTICSYFLGRAFLRFDVSDVHLVPASGTLSVHGITNSGIARVVCVKANQGASLTTPDWDAIPGWQTGGGDQTGNVTIYSTVRVAGMHLDGMILL